MPLAIRTSRAVVALAALAAAIVYSAAAVAQTLPVPLLKEGTTVKVSDHVWVIPDGGVVAVPNVGIIVGSRATLIVDTGLGIPNGEIVMREVARLSKHTEVYVATTHYHPEHTTGGVAFPASFKFVRAQSQQEDIKEFGAQNFKGFASRSPEWAALMKDSAYPRADILFERDYTLDLGGVRVQLTWLGPTHTRGDTAIFVEGENVLFTGDLAMKQLFPAFSSPYGDALVWLASLDRLDAMRPKVVVGSHGGIGDASLISDYRTIFRMVQARVKELKAQGASEADAEKMLTSELVAKYPNWGAPVRVAAAVKVFYKLP